MVDTVHIDPAAHHLQKLFGNTETESGALDIPVHRLVYALKRAEQIVETFLADPLSRILDGYAEQDRYRG